MPAAAGLSLPAAVLNQILASFGGHLLQSKRRAVRQFAEWFEIHRAPWLEESFLHVQLQANNVHIRAILEPRSDGFGVDAPAPAVGRRSSNQSLHQRGSSRNSESFGPVAAAAAGGGGVGGADSDLAGLLGSPASPVSLDVHVQTFTSNNVPHQWAFGGTSVLFHGQPLISIGSFVMDRVGATSAFVPAGTPGPAGAGSVKLPTTPSPMPHSAIIVKFAPPKFQPLLLDHTYSERSHLLAEYLDFAIQVGSECLVGTRICFDHFLIYLNGHIFHFALYVDVRF